jgi:hypothetical protein
VNGGLLTSFAQLVYQFFCEAASNTGYLLHIGSCHCMIQQFYIKQFFGFSLFCGISKCFIGKVLFILSKTWVMNCQNRESVFRFTVL